MGQAGSRAAVPRKVVPRGVSRNTTDPSPSIPKQNDFPARPAPPEAKPIIEPFSDSSDWNRGDPKYGALVQQVVGKITSHSAPTEGKVEKAQPHARSMPFDRHTNVASGLTDEIVPHAGKINLSQLRELLTEYSLHAENSVDISKLAEKYSLDSEVLKKVVGQISNPVQTRSRGLNVH